MNTHVDSSDSSCRQSVINLPGSLIRAYLTIMKRFAADRSLGTVTLLGASLTGMHMYIILAQLGITIENVFDANLAGRHFFNLRVGDSSLLFKDNKNLSIIICSSRPEDQLLDLRQQLEACGHTVYTLSSIITDYASHGELWQLLYQSLPGEFGEKIFKNDPRYFWDNFGPHWYCSARYAGKDKPAFMKDLRTFREFIRDIVQAPRPESILEIGIGNGGNFDVITETFLGKYFGLDISPALIAGNAGLRSRTVISDITTQFLPFKENSVDMLFTTSVLQHIPPAAVQRVIREFMSISRSALFHWEGFHEEKGIFYTHDLPALYRNMGCSVEPIPVPAALENFNKGTVIQCLLVTL